MSWQFDNPIAAAGAVPGVRVILEKPWHCNVGSGPDLRFHDAEGDHCSQPWNVPSAQHARALLWPCLASRGPWHWGPGPSATATRAAPGALLPLQVRLHLLPKSLQWNCSIMNVLINLRAYANDSSAKSSGISEALPFPSNMYHLVLGKILLREGSMNNVLLDNGKQ